MSSKTVQACAMRFGRVRVTILKSLQMWYDYTSELYHTQSYKQVITSLANNNTLYAAERAKLDHPLCRYRYDAKNTLERPVGMAIAGNVAGEVRRDGFNFVH